MRLAPVCPWKFGPLMPVGMMPATTFHCTGVDVAPVLAVVLHPVVEKLTTGTTPGPRLTGPDGGVMTQLPVGGAGVAGTGVTEGVQPDSVAVAIGVRPESETVTLQSGAEKPLAWMLNSPRWSERTPAELVAERAMTKIPGAALLPCTRSCPPFSSPLVTVTADAPSAMASWPPIAQRAAVVTKAARIMRVTFMGTSRGWGSCRCVGPEWGSGT